MLQHCCLWFLSLSLSLFFRCAYLPLPSNYNSSNHFPFCCSCIKIASHLFSSSLFCSVFPSVHFVSVSKQPFGKYSISLSLSFLEVTPKSVGLFPTHQPTTLRWFPRSNTLGEFHRDRGCITGRSL